MPQYCINVVKYDAFIWQQWWRIFRNCKSNVVQKFKHKLFVMVNWHPSQMIGPWQVMFYERGVEPLWVFCVLRQKHRLVVIQKIVTRSRRHSGCCPDQAKNSRSRLVSLSLNWKRTTSSLSNHCHSVTLAHFSLNHYVVILCNNFFLCHVLQCSFSSLANTRISPSLQSVHILVCEVWCAGFL